MSKWQFLWAAVWGARDAMTRASQIAFVTVPSILAGAISWFSQGSDYELPYWVSLLILGCGFGYAVFSAVLQRGHELEGERIPKVIVSDALSVTQPKGAPEKAFRTIRLRIENNSTATIKNCRVREDEFVNAFGQPSGQRRHFRLSEEHGADITKHTHRRTFDLQGRGDAEFIDIAECDETISGDVRMLYASDATALPLNTIPRRFFPHILTIAVSADNLAVPQKKRFRLMISDAGLLRLETIG